MKPTVADLQIINSRLPGTKLNTDQVEILPFRLFDDRVTDRHTVMSIEMMRKLVKDANDGVIAFNGLHRSSSTLPIGRSVEAKLTVADMNNEVLVKMYAVTKRPDGTPLEDGKDIADRYNTGAVYACSAGVYVGYYKCSICGNDIRDWQNCDHYPGGVYIIDEKPTTCIATMTGKDIQNGIAMDCGCYECSAVTAGGVRKASVLTETFSTYANTADIKEFKKTQFDAKQVSEVITLMPYSSEHTEEESNMPGQEDTLLQKNYDLIEAKAKVEVELATLKGEFSSLQAAFTKTKETVDSFATELESAKSALASALSEKEEFAKKVEAITAEFDTAKVEFEAKEKCFDTTKTDLEAFKTAFISVVESNGVKISREADYASKSVEELITLNDEYLAEIAKLPSGQQSDNNQQPTELINAYAGIPDEMFKSN